MSFEYPTDMAAASRKSTSPLETVRIIRAGHTAYLSPAIATVIEMLNHARQILPNTDVEFDGEIASIVPWFTSVDGTQNAMEPRWCAFSGRPELILPAGNWFAFPRGLADFAKRSLEELGHCVDDLDPSEVTHTPFIENCDLMNGAAGHEFRFLSQILAEPRGLVQTRSKNDQFAYATLIARLFPDARIAVAVATVEQANRFHREIGRRLDEPIGIIHAQSRHNRGRCSFVTFQVLDAMSFDSVDVIIIPDAVDAVASVPLTALARLGTQRVYAFLNVNDGLNDLDRLKLQAFVGPRIYRAPAHENKAVVSVMMCAAPKSNSCRNNATHFSEREWMRQMIWKNASRNKFIADLAYACVVGNVERCRQLGLRELGTAASIMSNEDGVTRIAILVEGTEHACSLQKLIPEATVIEKDPERPGTRVRSITPRSDLRISIVTTVAAELDQCPSEVVIRASGDVCTRRSQLLPRLCVPEDGNNQQLLIDLSDGTGDHATTGQNRRRSIYIAQGWTVCG